MGDETTQLIKRDRLFAHFFQVVAACAFGGIVVTWLYYRSVGEGLLYAVLSHLTVAAWIVVIVLGLRLQQIQYELIVSTSADAARAGEPTKQSFRLGMWLILIGLAVQISLRAAVPYETIESNPILLPITVLTSLAVGIGFLIGGYGALVRLKFISRGMLAAPALARQSFTPDTMSNFASIGRNIRNMFVWIFGAMVLVVVLAVAAHTILPANVSERLDSYLAPSMAVIVVAIAFWQSFPDFKLAWKHRRVKRTPPKAPPNLVLLQDACLAAGFIWVVFLTRAELLEDRPSLLFSGAIVFFGAALLVKLLRYRVQERVP